MFGWLFGKKKEVDEMELVKESTQKSFNAVKNDINNLTTWVKHLNNQQEKTDFRIDQIEESISTIENEIEGVKNSFAFMEGAVSKRVFKQPQTAVRKQTAVQGVYEPVQTAVQTAENHKNIYADLTTTERATVHVLLNATSKLRYEDLAAILGKSRATIRGQINAIRQKKEGLIEEVIEANGKKLLYIPEEIKEMVAKSGKVRVKNRER